MKTKRGSRERTIIETMGSYMKNREKKILTKNGKTCGEKGWNTGVRAMKIGKKQKTAYGSRIPPKTTPKQELIDSMKNIISSTTFGQKSKTVSDRFPKQSVFMSSTTFTLHCFVVLSVLITAAALVVLPRGLETCFTGYACPSAASISGGGRGGGGKRQMNGSH